MTDRRPNPGNQTSLREANRSRILAAVKRHGGLTQVELAGATGLSPATVSNIVKELSGSGVLHTAPSTHSGRRAMRVTLAHGLGLVAGVHIGRRHLWVGLSDMSGVVVSEHRMPLARDHRSDNELDKVALMIVDMLESVDSGVDELVAIGMGVSAPIDRRSGTIATRGIMRGWAGVPIAETMSARLAKPVHVDNSANLIALAEARYGAGRGRRDLVVLDVGDGIGAGLLVDGRLLRGHRGAAGEFGHVVVDPDGPLCRCGSRGCLEAVAGAQAVLDAVDDGRPMSLTELIVGAMAGESRAGRAIADAGRTIGRAAAGLCNLVDPERVIVTGELARAGELLLGPMRHAMEANLLLDPDGTPDLVAGQVGPNAAVQGAVALAIEHAPITAEVTAL